MSILVDLFDENIKRKPEETAILFCDETRVSYSQLNSIVNRISNYMTSEGLTVGDVVAIANHKTKYGYAMMIACIKLGIIYTNFDYSNPVERINKMMDRAKPKIVLNDLELEDKLAMYPETFQYTDVPSDTPAYIMFTSGSTGVPKGVLIKQSAIYRLIKWAKEAYSLREDDIMTNVNPIYFDNSVFDFYCSIFNGITMAAFPIEIVSNPKELILKVNELRCTFWFSVPSLLIYLTNIRCLHTNIFEYMRSFAFGGEGYPKPLLKKLVGYFPECDFYNVYGPTEGTCICSAYKICESDLFDDDGLVTLGTIAPIFEYKIVDGELWLGGEQIALGYYNDVERTRERFVDGWYRTGDLVEEIEGRLFFRGRVDYQIKHMGYRIELEEIESGIMKVGGISRCAVIHGKNKNGFSHIVAFVTSKGVDSDFIREKLKDILPSYMIPSDIYVVDDLPRNSNGKIDKVALKQNTGLS